VTVTVHVFALVLQHGTGPHGAPPHCGVIATPFWKTRMKISTIDVPSMTPGLASASGQLNVSVTGVERGASG
jgi:hypothetical protein